MLPSLLVGCLHGTAPSAGTSASLDTPADSSPDDSEGSERSSEHERLQPERVAVGEGRLLTAGRAGDRWFLLRWSLEDQRLARVPIAEHELQSWDAWAVDPSGRWLAYSIHDPRPRLRVIDLDDKSTVLELETDQGGARVVFALGFDRQRGLDGQPILAAGLEREPTSEEHVSVLEAMAAGDLRGWSGPPLNVGPLHSWFDARTALYSGAPTLSSSARWLAIANYKGVSVHRLGPQGPEPAAILPCIPVRPASLFDPSTWPEGATEADVRAWRTPPPHALSDDGRLACLAARGEPPHATSLGLFAEGVVAETCSTSSTAAFRLLPLDENPGARSRDGVHHGLLVGVGSERVELLEFAPDGAQTRIAVAAGARQVVSSTWAGDERRWLVFGDEPSLQLVGAGASQRIELDAAPRQVAAFASPGLLAVLDEGGLALLRDDGDRLRLEPLVRLHLNEHASELAFELVSRWWPRAAATPCPVDDPASAFVAGQRCHR
ncbi:MAG: hypothetical protein R6X02_12670 [Enhygromyxa sp.]